MNAKFDLSVTSQSSVFFEGLKIKASEKLIGFSKKNRTVAKFIGLPIGICSSLLDLAQAVSSIGESLIKGIANIFGSLLFFENCSFSRGVKQIFLQVPLKLVNESFGLAIGTVYKIVGRPLYMFVFPTESLQNSKYLAEKKKEFLEGLTNETLDEEILKLQEKVNYEFREMSSYNASGKIFALITVISRIRDVAVCASFV